MSANLWSAENVTPAENPEDGIYACSGTRGVRTNVALDRLAENQTFHCGFSANPGADDALNVTLCYRDAAGSVNYADIPHASVPAGKWTRVSGSVVIPSGMTVFQMVICNNGNASGASGWKVMNPTLSLGSPVCLASSAHTPYATQDHVSTVYATKASLKVTDDSVKAEVKARIKTDRMVSEVSSRLTQTADGFSASIDRLSDTDKKVNSWFGFGSDSSGNPQLTMGSSTSPVVGVYTNAGLAYKARSGATLLELDGASRSSTMPHVHADDVSIGSWQWVPTQNGTHFTLQWIGG